MSTGYSIVGTHVGDFLSVGVSETVTVGNTGLATTMRIYDCNAPLNGYLVTTSNGVFTINEANNSIPTNVGIGTTAPRSTATLQVQGTLLASNIGTYGTNTLFFNNNSIAGISNISTFGYITTSTPAYGDNSCNVATTGYVQNELAQFTGGGAVTGNSSNMPKLTSIGTSNLTTTIQGALIVNSNLTVKGIVAQTNQFGYIALSPIVQTSSSCNIYVTNTSSGTVYPMMSTVLNNVTTPYATSGLQFNVETQTLKSSNIIIDNSILFNNAFGQITLGSVIQQTNLVPFSNIIGLPSGSVPFGSSTNYMSNIVGTSGQVLVSGGSGAPSWTNTITSPSLVTPTLVGNSTCTETFTTNTLSVSGTTTLVGNSTCTGTFTTSNFTVNGTTTIINSTIINSSNIVINNTGTGPALSVTQQQNTAQPVAQFVAGSTNAMYINNKGYVGFGTTNPLTLLSITSNIVGGIGPILSINNTGGMVGSTSVLEFNIYAGQGTNNTYPAGAQIRAIDDGNYAANMLFYTKQTGVNTNPLTERMRVTSIGNVGIGTTNPGGVLHVFTSNIGGVLLGNITASFDVNAVVQIQGVASSKAALATYVSATTSQTHIGFNNNSGASGAVARVGSIVTTASATAYNTSSDYRLKTNVRTLNNASSIIQQLKPVTFNFNCDLTTDVDGFIAHEVQELVPLAVTGTKDAVQEDGTIEPQGMDSKMLIPHLVKCCQELMGKIEILNDRIAILEQK